MRIMYFRIYIYLHFTFRMWRCDGKLLILYSAGGEYAYSIRNWVWTEALLMDFISRLLNLNVGKSLFDWFFSNCESLPYRETQKQSIMIRLFRRTLSTMTVGLQRRNNSSTFLLIHIYSYSISLIKNNEN